MFAKQTWEATLSKELRLFDTNVEIICNFECANESFLLVKSEGLTGFCESKVREVCKQQNTLNFENLILT